MKLYLSILLTFSICQCFAQDIKLKIGQRFTYEWKKTLTSNNNVESVNYIEIDFEVLDHTGGYFILKTNQKRNFIYSPSTARIKDSSKPLSFFESDLESITSEALVNNNLIVTLNNRGEITSIDDNSAKEEIRNKLVSLKLSDNEKNTSEQLNALLYSLCREPVEFIFEKKQRNDTSYIEDRSQAGSGVEKDSRIKDSITVTIKKTLDKKAGLSTTLMVDSSRTRYGQNVYGKLKSSSTTILSLKSSNVKYLKSSNVSLFDFINEQIDFKQYYDSTRTAIRKVEDLGNWYYENKGKLGIQKMVLNNLDSLDRGLSKTNYEYLAAKADLIGVFDDEKKGNLIDRIPVEYLLHDDVVIRKAQLAYQKNDLQGFVKALKVLFEKFSIGVNCPLNIEHLWTVVHSDIAKDVYNIRDKSQLNNILRYIDQAEKLDFPKLTEIFAGLKFYILARMATSPADFIAIKNQNFNTPLSNFGRYRLLIYDLMIVRKVPDSIHQAYLKTSVELLKKGLEKTEDPDEDDGSILGPITELNRTLLRKQLADAYYRESMVDKSSGSFYLHMASDHLPTLTEHADHSSDLELEYYFFPKKNYTELYLNFSGKSGVSSEEKLKKYVDLVILQPDKYSLLKEEYKREFPKGDFLTFFNKALQQKLPATPDFNLQEISGKTVNGANQKGKFMFIDFWGTWCGACVDEIHKINDLFLQNKNDRLTITTIACHDKTELVIDFMNQKNYSYPVLMSNNIIEKKFSVKVYPTKVLLLPIGVYIVIPPSENYIQHLAKYMSWEL